MELWQLKQMQSLPLEAKIIKSQQRIREWYEHWDGDVYVSFSGGKDSTVLLHLVRELYPDVPYSTIYDMGYRRTGCIFCMFGCHLEPYPNRFQRLSQTHPKLYEYCMKPASEGGWGWLKYWIMLVLIMSFEGSN